MFIALIGAVALMLLTGIAGQISLGHAGLIAAGAFTTGILFKETNAPIWITLPASGLVGAILGVAFGLPSLRLRGLYLALSTLALHFIVTFAGSEYETQRGFATGIVLDPPHFGPLVIENAVVWYFFLLLWSVAVVIFALNLLRSCTVGPGWPLEIATWRQRHSASRSGCTSLRFCRMLGADQYGRLPVRLLQGLRFSRSLLADDDHRIHRHGDHRRARLDPRCRSGCGLRRSAPGRDRFPRRSVCDTYPSTTYMFAIKHSSFGLIMILFLILEPNGLAGLWIRIRDYFLLWPFKYRPIGG